MKKHNLFKVIGITIIIAVLLTWIFPITYFGYGLTEEVRSQVGLFEFFSYGPVVFQYFGSIIFYVLAIGGFYGVLHKTDGYRNLLDKIVKKFEGKEWLFLSVIMVLFALITSMAGLTSGLLFIFPFVISIILLMGYNKQTAALVTVGAVAIGLIGTTLSAMNTNIIHSVLETKLPSEMITRVILLVLGLTLLIYNTLKYARANKDTKNIKKELLPESKDKKKKVWPIIVIIDVILIIMILASISWEAMYKIDLFAKITESIMKFEIGGFPIFGKLLGTEYALAFEKWSLNELTILIVLGSMLISLLYRKGLNNYIKSFFEGMKKAFKPAILIFLAYLVLVIMATHPVLLALFKPLLTATNGFNAFTMSIVAIINNIFNMEMYYSATAVLPYAASIIKDATTYPIIAVIWQAMYGLTMLIAPTSVILIATLSYLDLTFGQWLKTIWKLLVQLLIVLLIIFTILVLI